MRKTITNWVIALALVASVGGVLVTTASPFVVSAATADCNGGFLGFPAWYRGLTDGDCNVISPNDPSLDAKEGNRLPKFIWHIALNVIEIVLVAVAYLSGFYTLYGGFLFIISRGKPEGAAKARMAILDSIIGLLIALAALAMVQFIFTGIFG